MSFINKKSKILITCSKGSAPVLADEISYLGFPVIDKLVSGVETEGTLDNTMVFNLRLRTAQSVLYLIRNFKAENPHVLYKRIYDIHWEDYIDPNGYICINSFVENPSIKDNRFANLKSKDAIADRFMNRYGRRPDSGSDKTGTVIYLHWKNDQVQIYLDTSGESLSKRGYRTVPLKAPMQETLAASLILSSRWDHDKNFINPMCGSGTLAIEATLIALNKAPGLLRKNFGFMHIKGFDKITWQKLRNNANRETKKELNFRIIATDISDKAVEAARKNAENAGIMQFIEFSVCDFSDTPIPTGSGVIILNPEYGKRLGDIEKLENTYREIGNFFKQKCQGYQGYIFTGTSALGKHVGLKTKRKLTFYNSNIECRLLEYELYKGSGKY